MKKKYFFLLLFIPLFTFSQGSGNTLSFNGTNDYVNVNTVANGIRSIEFWFKPNSTYNSSNMTEPASLIVRNTNPYPVEGELQMYIAPSAWTGPGNDGKLAFSRYIGTSQNQIVSDSNEWLGGVWYHITGVIDQDNGMELYVNGIKQINTNSSVAPIDTRTEITTFGKWGDLNIRYFNGTMDEVRFWNSALSQSEITDWMTKKVTSSHPKYANLVAYYNFDSGIGTTLVDQTSNGNDGTLINSPTWQISSAPIGDDNSYLTSVNNTSSLNLVNSDGSDLTVNVTSGTAESLYIYNVNEAPKVTTPPLGLDQLSQTNYWGVKAFGSASLVYEVIYNYQGHIGISDENNLRLSSRDNNASLSWTEQSATLNTAANTLVLGGQTGTEFILGSVGGNTLPVEGFELLELSIYPNPTKNVIKLREVNAENQRFEVYDINGRIVLEGKLNNSKEIEVKSLNAGLYYLNLDNKQHFKFLKE